MSYYSLFVGAWEQSRSFHRSAPIRTDPRLGSCACRNPVPIPWLTAILNGVEHANFFEARATEYSKAAMKGDWHGQEGVWDAFEAMMQRRKSA